MARAVALLWVAGLTAGCSSSPSPESEKPDASFPRPGDAGADADARDGAPSAVIEDSGSDAASGLEGGSDGALAERFVTQVVSFDPGECGGFGASSMPGIVEGPPYGGGKGRGGTDVVSLGTGGSIVVAFAPNAIIDGPGADFIVFENPFFVGGNANDVYAEPGEVSVSDDGVAWTIFPCQPTQDPESPHGTGVGPPYDGCAGIHPVLSNPSNGISPLDPSVAGGDPFDLHTIGVTHARFVRIVDKTQEDCAESGSRPNTNGFDLDAVSIVNAETP